MLINSFEHNVDAKGRLFIPAKWREDLGSTIIITRGMLGKSDRRCLFGMSLTTWDMLLERYNKIAMTDVKAQNALRMTFANLQHAAQVCGHRQRRGARRHGKPHRNLERRYVGEPTGSKRGR